MLMAQEQELSKGSKNPSRPATLDPQALVSPFESHYLPHKISISSDEQNSITSRTKYKVALKKIPINYAIPTIPIKLSYLLFTATTRIMYDNIKC